MVRRRTVAATLFGSLSFLPGCLGLGNSGDGKHAIVVINECDCQRTVSVDIDRVEGGESVVDESVTLGPGEQQRYDLDLSGDYTVRIATGELEREIEITPVDDTTIEFTVEEDGITVSTSMP